MNYDETIEFLYKQLPVFQRTGKAAYKANLNNTIALDKHFNYPHKLFKSVHVAGTNGKGSVANMLTSVLMDAGYKVGLYTSPHLKSFRERVKVNGEMISKDYVINFVNSSKSIIEELIPSFFELTVALAFKYFAEEKVDIAIIEVGLGGRLDSTNIISPDVSVITNISFDHTEFLGNTLEQIATEKAGIIKNGIPVVIGETNSETEDVFRSSAKKNNSEIYFADQLFRVDLSLSSIDGKKIFYCKGVDGQSFDELKLGLLGDYQSYNLRTALCCLDVMNKNGYKINKENIYSGLENIIENTGILGRWQILGASPKIIADTGHNFAGVSEVVSQINNTPFKKLHIVIGFVNDKNIDKILNLFPKNAIYYFTKANIPRALELDILLRKANEVGLEGSVYQTVELALNAAKESACIDDMIFVGGSTFVVAEIV